MKKGIIFGMGVGILIIGIIVGAGIQSTPTGIPELGGLPSADDNEMSMSDSVSVSVNEGKPQSIEETSLNELTTRIEVNLDDGVGSSDQN